MSALPMVVTGNDTELLVAFESRVAETAIIALPVLPPTTPRKRAVTVRLVLAGNVPRSQVASWAGGWRGAHVKPGTSAESGVKSNDRLGYALMRTPGTGFTPVVSVACTVVG